MEVERQLFAGLKFDRKRFKKDIAIFEVPHLTDPIFEPQTLSSLFLFGEFSVFLALSPQYSRRLFNCNALVLFPSP